MINPKNNITDIIGTVYYIPEHFRVAYLKCDDGTQFCFADMTPGIRLTDLKEGQRYRCVLDSLRRVTKASLIGE